MRWPEEGGGKSQEIEKQQKVLLQTLIKHLYGSCRERRGKLDHGFRGGSLAETHLVGYAE